MRTYRTLIRGKLSQRSSLVVGGSLARAGGADIQCARDGAGRLTLPGTGLAGCLVDTAGRIFPTLFDAREDSFWRRITGKTTTGPAEILRQSLWHFHAAHLEQNWLEWRQGVGIRQATGATALEGKALFDLESIPPGGNWGLFMEIDSQRGGAEVESIALRALADWARGRCWLGAGCARGLGWLDLIDWEVLRLPSTAAAIAAWPSNQGTPEDQWRQLANLPGVQRVPGNEVQGFAEGLWPEAPLGTSYYYLHLEGVVGAGKHEGGYGYDALSVGGHVASLLQPLRERLLHPRGVPAGSWKYEPDCPVVTSGPSVERQRPFVPGSGVRGPLRHAASRWLRSQEPAESVPDPNTRAGGEPPTESPDVVSQLFGLTGHSAGLLISDARLERDGHYLLACLQHHAEDEFAGGVYGSGKFDRTVVLEGDFRFGLVVEARNVEVLHKHISALQPALRLAELGLAPLGGAKTRGAGGKPWQFQSIRAGRAGQPTGQPLALRGCSVLDALPGVLENLS